MHDVSIMETQQLLRCRAWEGRDRETRHSQGESTASLMTNSRHASFTQRALHGALSQALVRLKLQVSAPLSLTEKQRPRSDLSPVSLAVTEQEQEPIS